MVREGLDVCRNHGQSSLTAATRTWLGGLRHLHTWISVSLALGFVFLEVPGTLSTLGDESVVTDWTTPKFYQLEIEDPSSHSKPVRVFGKMGEPVTKTLILRNYSPQRIEDVVLSIGLLKYDQFPPSKLPAPRVFLPIPGNWRIEPRTSLIGTLGPEEDTEVNFSIRLNKVGRYSLVFAARGRPEGGGNETVLWDTIWVELEPGSGHSPRITVIRLIAMAMLAGCGAVFVRKKSHTPY